MGCCCFGTATLGKDAVYALAGRQTVKSLQSCNLVKPRPASGCRELCVFSQNLAASWPRQSLLPVRMLERNAPR